MANTIFIPEQHYVGFQCRRELVEGKHDAPDNEKFVNYYLGFATPYAKDKAFEKRKKTVDAWSAETNYHNGEWKFKVPYKAGMTQQEYADYNAGRYWVPNGTWRKQEILKNELREGFVLEDSVRRSGSWNGGNVVWRILDPRGFQLEITSENLAQILFGEGIENGVIKGRCIWGRQGSVNVLLPEGSEPYRQSITEAEKNASKLRELPVSDVKPGDKVLLSGDRTAVYLGQFEVLYYWETHDYSHAWGQRRTHRQDSSTVCFVYDFSESNAFRSLLTYKSQRALKVLERPDEPFSDQRRLARAIEAKNKKYGDHAYIGNEYVKIQSLEPC